MSEMKLMNLKQILNKKNSNLKKELPLKLNCQRLTLPLVMMSFL